MQVEVLDGIMGSGKTSELLKWLKPEMNFIFVTPLLTEAEDRIKSVRPDLAVKCPEPVKAKVDGEWVNSKAEDLLLLLQARENIATTHALLRNADERHWKLIQQFNYIIILDEEINLIESFSGVTSADMLWLFDNGHLSRDASNGRLTFNDTSAIEDFKYAEVKEMCRKGVLYSANRSNKFVVSCLPIDVLMCANRVIILTYMFKGSVLEQFLSLHGVGWRVFDEVSLPKLLPSDFKHLLLGVPDYTYHPYDKLKLTQSSWSKMSGEGVLQVEKTLYNVFRPYVAEECGFAVPKYFVARSGHMKNRLVKPKGKVHKVGQETWLYPKCRATNEYAHKRVMVYALDVYPNSAVQAYLSDMGCVVDEKLYALSQLVQWLWRGCIRNGEPMTAVVLAPRMRKLLKAWLNDEFEKPVDSIVCAPFNGMGAEWPAEDKQNLFDALNKFHVATAEDDVYDQIQMPTMVWEGLED